MPELTPDAYQAKVTELLGTLNVLWSRGISTVEDAVMFEFTVIELCEVVDLCHHHVANPLDSTPTDV